MSQVPNVKQTLKSVVKIGVVLGALGTLGGCFQISQRAWANGAAMTESRAYREVLSGNTSFEAHRQLQSTLNPRRLNYTEHQYSPFSRWW
jgi:hypothetical protein